MRKQIEIDDRDYLKTLDNCNGYYSCPIREGTGERLGPLVGYAGTYEAPDGKKLQFVGDVYANFAKAEVHSDVLQFFAGRLLGKLFGEISVSGIDAFVGAPIGGYSLATALGIQTGFDVIKAEKKVTALASETSREKSKLVFARHSVEKGDRCVIVEDVCNNFSTTDDLINLIVSARGTVVAIACFLNRSLAFDNSFAGIPVVSLVRLPINEWRQDDIAVINDVARGNVVLKPKDEWDRLKKAMKAHI